MRISTYAQRMLMQDRSMDLNARIQRVSDQMSSGMKADSFKELRGDTTQVLTLRTRIETVKGYSATIAQTDNRLQTIQNALGRAQTIAKEVSLLTVNGSTVGDTRLDGVQSIATTRAEEVISALNLRVGDRQVFGGRETTKVPVAPLDQILNGDPSALPAPQTGLKAGIATRLAVDGAAAAVDLPAGEWPGRVEVERTGSTITLRLDDPAYEGFGFQLQSLRIEQQGGPATVIPAAAAPDPDDPTVDVPTIAFDASATAFYPGQRISIALKMPDGSDFTITLTGTDDPQDGRPDTFLANAGAIQNLGAAITRSLEDHALNELKAASTQQASTEFFDVPPKEIALDTTQSPARYVVRQDDDNSVLRWYRGDTSTDDIRGSVVAKIDDNTVLQYGVRADEPALRDVLKNLATLAAVPYDGTEVEAYRTLAVGIGARLGDVSERSEDLIGIIGTKQELLAAVKERQAAYALLSETQLTGLQSTDLIQAQAFYSMYETQLQASYSITARLQSLSLLSFLR